ncbi:MFS family permease [Inhella inkyongensis]|uniref:MFS family permease n=1 Tax=Inhella inkyongensis TaxID=392593 RepID=A0A840S8X1_9BURK|nr:MFS transporter [Inhella inkyongensis]MBB5204981.1 MFS family permease [Inhella inkyongensis]
MTDTALFAPGRRAACLGALALVTLLAFEAVAVAAAMPAIAQALDGLGLYALAFGGTLALSVLGMVWAGRACDVQGPFAASVIGLVVFGAGLALSGLAPSMGWLTAGRALQGLGVGVLGVTLYVGIARLVPAALHPRLFAALAAAWVLPGLVGPFVAALLVETLGWRAVFLGVLAAVPFTAWAMLPALHRLPPQAATKTQADPNLAWAALAAVAALALHGASQAGTAWMPAVIALGLLAALPAGMRLLPAGTLNARPGLPAVIALRGLMAAAFFSAEAFIPLFLNQQRAWSLTEGGLALTAAALTWSAGSALQARIQGETRRAQGLRAGLGLLALGLLAVAWPMLDAGVSPLWVVGGWALSGLGIGLAWPMLSVLTLALSAEGEQGRNTSALQLCDALTTSAALALAGLLFGAGRSDTAFAAVIALALGLAVLGMGVTGRVFAGARAGN